MLYDIAFLIFSIFYLPTLIFKGKLHGDFLERFGIYAKEKRRRLASGSKKIWIQAVSVGEVSLCKSIIPQLKNVLSDYEIVFSTITKSGNDLAKKLFSKDAVIIYFPLDFSFITRGVVRFIKPKAYIMIETEIWPNMLGALSRESIPSVLINGRISDNSFGNYRIVRMFLRDVLKKVNKFCMQSEDDAERMVYLGAPEERVKVTGNMKFDVDFFVNAGEAEEVRKALDLKPGEELFVAGSTHPGEEEAVISVFRDLAPEFPHLKLLIAPRHIERTEDVELVVRRAGLVPVRVSELGKGIQAAGSGSSALILDTIGRLKDVYSAATLVFVGGSLVKHGGQNPIEPAAYGRPVMFGPYMFNFKNIASILADNDGAIQIYNTKELLDNSRALLKDAGMRDRIGANASRIVMENRGAARRNLEAILGMAV